MEWYCTRVEEAPLTLHQNHASLHCSSKSECILFQGALRDKINIWHKIMNGSVKAAFPVDIFRTHFTSGLCSIRGFGKAWFTEFDAGVCRLLATPVFNFSLANSDLEVALRYLGLGAQCSPDDLDQLCRCLVAADLAPPDQAFSEAKS